MTQEELNSCVDSRLKNQICFPLYLCAKEITGKYNEILKEMDLTYTQYIVMLYFGEVGQSNLKDISAALMLDASTLTPLLKKLEAKGFIKKKADEKDRRNLSITLTQKGKKLLDDALDVPEKVAKSLDFSLEDAANIRSLSSSIIQKIRKAQKK